MRHYRDDWQHGLETMLADQKHELNDLFKYVGGNMRDFNLALYNPTINSYDESTQLHQDLYDSLNDLAQVINDGLDNQVGFELGNVIGYFIEFNDLITKKDKPITNYYLSILSLAYSMAVNQFIEYAQTTNLTECDTSPGKLNNFMKAFKPRQDMGWCGWRS